MTREMAPERGEGLLEESTGVAPSQESTRSPQVILHIKEGDGAIEASAVERSEDDDLTSLTWLQDKNLLKGINLRTSANGGASAAGGGNISIADSGGGGGGGVGPTVIVGSNAAHLNSPVNGGTMLSVKQESPTSDYAEDCPSEQSESTCSSVASGSPVPPHHYHNNHQHHHHQAQLHLAHQQQHHSSHHYQTQSNHSHHQSQPQLQQHTLSSSAKNKHPHHIPYDPKVHVTSKPPYSFSCLIFMSIEDSKLKALPVKEIYTWILDHFPYYRNAPTGWKNSVRHNLSLNKCFRKVDKAPNLGKGSLWMVDPVSRPKLVEALMKAPYHPYTNLDKNSSTSSLRKRSPSPDTGAGTQEDELDDVDAAAAMLVLKHGPQARLHISHTREEYHKRQKMALQATTPPNGLKIKEEESISMAQDHTYSWADSSIEQASADEAFAEGSDSNSSSIRGFCDDEERRKTAEGADALLNLAGITTTSTPSIGQQQQTPPPLKKFRSSSPTPPRLVTVQYHHRRHHLDAVNNNDGGNNNTTSSVSSGDESGGATNEPCQQVCNSNNNNNNNNKLRRKPACPQRIKTKR